MEIRNKSTRKRSQSGQIFAEYLMIMALMGVVVIFVLVLMQRPITNILTSFRQGFHNVVRYGDRRIGTKDHPFDATHPGHPSRVLARHF